MPAINLRGMDVDALLALRTEIDKRLGQKRSELEQQLSRLGLESSAGGHARGWGSSGRRRFWRRSPDGHIGRVLLATVVAPEHFAGLRVEAVQVPHRTQGVGPAGVTVTDARGPASYWTRSYTQS